MDAVVIIAVISGLSALVVSIGTHFKHSQCCKGFCECDTRSPRDIVEQQPKPEQSVFSVSPMSTPVVVKKEITV